MRHTRLFLVFMLTALWACFSVEDDAPDAPEVESSADSEGSSETCDSACFEPELDTDFDAELEWDLAQCYNEDAYCRFGYGIDDEGCEDVLINGRCYGSMPSGGNVSSGCGCYLKIPLMGGGYYWGNVGFTLAYSTCDSPTAQYTCPFTIWCDTKVGGCP